LDAVGAESGAVVAPRFFWPLAVHAQQGEQMRRVGVLMKLANSLGLAGVQELGWTHRRNVQIDTRWGGGEIVRVRAYAAELVRSALDICPGVLAKRITIGWTSDRFSIGIIAIWPFLFLWPYTLHDLSIGNDFLYAQYNYNAYLLVAFSSWHFPLWSPTELAGYPFFSNPFAQAVYPLNLLYVAFYAVSGNFSVWHYTLFTIMGISIFGIGLYYWLRRLVFPGYVALLAAMIACMSLKVTEIIRFPNAVHSAAWLPWLLLGITMAAARKDVVRGAITFGIATLMLLTAGYPYYVIYTPFLILPYFVAMLFAP